MERSRLTRSIWAATLAAIVAALALAACGGTSTATPLPTPTTTGAIAFTTEGDIYIVNADGTGLRQVTQDLGLEEQLSWSPDGSKIVYDDGEGGLWVVNADGSGKAKLTGGGEPCQDPSWSPDGNQIAFIRGVQNGMQGWAIYVVNADGSGRKRVTEGSKNDMLPSWSPDGRIVFERDREHNLYTVNSDGSGLVPLKQKADPGDYAVSPDGTQLAVAVGTGGRIEVVAMAGGGTPVTLVEKYSDFLGDAYANLTWTPDGTAVAMASSDGSRIYIVNADGTGLSSVPGVDAAKHPAWRPE